MALLFELVATPGFDMVHPGGVKEEAHLNSNKDVTKQASINEVCGSNSIALSMHSGCSPLSSPLWSEAQLFGIVP